ncbi:hypothetical protein Tco_0838299 [Tanacetum coccineum]|uniref:Zinc finger, CCHC-type n=1 Tax=Tanacetum coccineum TaxID=301880 RepID=A0ABQ5AQQ1_9ASTR
MHFLLSSISVVYVFTTLIPEYGDNATMEQIKRRNKWDNDDYDSLEAKYMAEDASSKKFLVSNFTNYKMADSRPVMKQFNELLGIIKRFTQHKMNMDEAIQVSYIIDKLPPSWKDFKHTLKHQKVELTLVEFGSHLRIEESLKVQDNDKPKGNNVVGPLVVNMMKHNNSFRYNDNKVGNKANGSGINGSVDGSTNSLKGQNMSNKSLQHSKAFMFYVIEPNESVSINSIIESRDAIFNEKKFSSVPKPSQRSFINETEDIGGLVVLGEVVTQQHEPELIKSKRNGTSKNFALKF